MGIKEKILKSMGLFLANLREKTLQTLEEVEANTNNGYWAGAGAVSELNNKLANGRIEIVVTEHGLGYKLDGADTVHPFMGTIKVSADLVVSCTNKYNFGDSRMVKCTITINGDSSVSIKNNTVTYEAVGRDGITVYSSASLVSPVVVYD